MFRNELFDVPWENIENSANVSDMVQVWNSLFLEIVNKYAPLKQHRVKKSRQPDWLNPDILDTIKERNKCKINGNIKDYKQFFYHLFFIIFTQRAKINTNTNYSI